MAATGMFIALEGGEGAGKSTLAQALAERLRAAGRPVRLTREPGGTSFGELVRDVLVKAPAEPWAETFAFLAARAQVVSEVIRPALAAGEDVLCDRFAASTFAYQGHGRGLDLTRLRVANTIATDGLVPDLTILVDVDPADGLARKRGETGAVRTGTEPPAFHERVRAGYLELAKEATPGTWVVLDGSRPAAAVADEAWGVVWPRIRPRRFDDGGVDPAGGAAGR